MVRLNIVMLFAFLMVSSGMCAQDPSSKNIGAVCSSLPQAVRDGDVQGVAACISKGSDPDMKMDGSGQRPLHVAAIKGKKDVIATLLLNGASVDMRDNAQYTPLIWAACKGHNAAVKLLLAAGADPNAQEMLGRTALDFAEKYGYIDTAAILRKAGGTTNNPFSASQMASMLVAAGGIKLAQSAAAGVKQALDNLPAASSQIRSAPASESQPRAAKGSTAVLNSPIASSSSSRYWVYGRLRHAGGGTANRSCITIFQSGLGGWTQGCCDENGNYKVYLPGSQYVNKIHFQGIAEGGLNPQIWSGLADPAGGCRVDLTIPE